MFYVGQKVECISIKNNPGHSWVFDDAPTVGAIYTVLDILTENGGPSLVLAGHPRHPMSKYLGFDARRFRPIVERKTDISALKALLNPANHRELVD